jgi:hypothetical protein
MSFRYDSAAAYDLTRQAVETGKFPWLGIENSLGFRNTGALLWMYLVPAWFSSQPEILGAFQGLLWALAIPAMGEAARLATSSRTMGLSAAALFALLPGGIFMAQGIWAQNLLPPLYAWSLYHTVWILTQAAKTPEGKIPQHSTGTLLTHGLLALTPALLGAMIHMAAGFLTLITVIIVVVQRAIPVRLRLFWLIPGFVAVLLSFPSLQDGWRSRHGREGGGAEVPAHIEKFRSLMPQPDPAWRRVFVMLGNIPAPVLTQNQDGGLGSVFEPGKLMIRSISVLDHVLNLLVLIGLGVVLFWVNQSRGLWRGGRQRVAVLLLLQIILPPILIALNSQYPNSSYLASSIPGLILILVLGLDMLRRSVGPQLQKVWAGFLTFLAFGLLVVGDYPRQARMALLSAVPPYPQQGVYYLPLREIRRVAAALATEGVGPNNFYHVSGSYFALPYKVLLKRMPVPESGSEARFAVIEDIPLRARIDGQRAQWLVQRATQIIEPMAILLFLESQAANRLMEEYLILPQGQPDFDRRTAK